MAILIKKNTIFYQKLLFLNFLLYLSQILDNIGPIHLIGILKDSLLNKDNGF